MRDSPTLSEAEFDVLLGDFLGRPPEKMDDDELVKLLSVAMGAHDRLLNELEKRGVVSAEDMVVPCVIPDSRYVESMLTRRD